jgi:CBS domain-containing protein
MRRSGLTEKVVRRGYHLSREYAVDPLEILFVREVIRTNVAAFSADAPVSDLANFLRGDHRRSQRLYPVLAADGHLTGVLTRSDLRKFLQAHAVESGSHRSPSWSDRTR